MTLLSILNDKTKVLNRFIFLSKKIINQFKL